MVNVLEYQGVPFFIITPLQVVHLTVGEIRAPVQSSTAIGTSQPLRQPSKIGANWRHVFPELMLSLPRLGCMQISSKSNQYTLEVANSTPETDEDCVP